MAGVNISAWMGKPPVRSKAAHLAKQNVGEDEEEILGQNTFSSSPPSVRVLSKDVSASSRGTRETPGRTHSPSPQSLSQSANGFYIAIPDISDREGYEHLAGYFTVHKILREVAPGHYLVKLKSGEIDLVSMPPKENSSEACLLLLCQVSPRPHLPFDTSQNDTFSKI
jgi:hypothetical protein